METNKRFFIYITVVIFFSILTGSLALNLSIVSEPKKDYKLVTEIAAITSLTATAVVLVLSIYDFSKE